MSRGDPEGGRPPKYLPEYCDGVIEDARAGYSLTAFAGKVGVSRNTIDNWRKVYPEFDEACGVHKSARCRTLEGNLMSGQNTVGSIFGLKNAAPEEWKDKHEVEHSGNVGIREWLTAAD